jgi:DNA polymerase-4
MFKALQLCPEATVIEPDMAKYKRVSLDIRNLLGSISDCIEPVSLDEAYLDLSDGHRLTEETAAHALARIALEIESVVGITISIGLSYNKFLAKLASDLEKPRGYSVLGSAEARSFLAALPVHKLHGVGNATAQRMEQQGLATVADLQALPERELVSRFGKLGRRLSQFVNGIDERHVIPERPTKSVSAETTFARDIRAEADLVVAAERLALRVSERLKRSGLAGRTLVIKLKTADFKILTRSRQLGRPTQRAELLIEQARRVIESEADGRAFRLIGVGVADIALASEADLPDLFT